MADPKLVEILKQGSEVWNQWRERQPYDVLIDLSDACLSNVNLRKADLNNANLIHADLRYSNLFFTNLHAANLFRSHLLRADLRGVNLSYANLSGANLYSADLSKADLSRANLSYANLYAADLSKADLYSANLSHADLMHSNLFFANLIDANLIGTDLSGAAMHKTVFANVDLRESKGLSEIDHQGPSRVELHTVQLPPDGSALHFLRGCGVPNEWIDDYRARIMYPIQYHSCFISYSSKDEALARRLHADLQAQGVRCWFAPEDMKIGDKIRSRIDEAIHLQDKLLLLLSEHALASSWVEVEVEAALEKEQRQSREVLFPVRLDESVMRTTQAWAKQLRRTRHIGDFTHWTNTQAYEHAFEKLLQSLKEASHETEM